MLLCNSSEADEVDFMTDKELNIVFIYRTETVEAEDRFVEPCAILPYNHLYDSQFLTF